MTTAGPLKVTDHAVVRWLERVCGVDIEHYRDEIRAAFSASGFRSERLPEAVFVDVPSHQVFLAVRDGEVTTILLYSPEDRDDDRP